MYRDTQSHVVSRIIKKELTLFFSSPMAYLFLGTFMLSVLFIFFWAETFFERNIADLRPMFEWMPFLLIFLSSALTMKMWSEERRSGTLEYVQTSAISLWQFVMGKFASCMILLSMALCLSFPLPVMVALLGDVDWGVVMTGYIATLLLGACYMSMGLFVSARCDNQIISLICSSLLGFMFYLLSAPFLVDILDMTLRTWFNMFGTDAHFRDITRGVIDARDVYYYVSLTLAFLAMNLYFLERERWAKSHKGAHTKEKVMLSFVLMNLFAVHLWLYQAPVYRIDMTEGQQYSLSETTKDFLKTIQEPLTIRAYFSEKTHPHLAPLVPQLEDLLEEYQIAGKGIIKVKYITPSKMPEEEKFANETFDIKPTPFTIKTKHEASVVNGYFALAVQYGDSYSVLQFTDLIEVKKKAQDGISIRLRNPEYDITQQIQKVMRDFMAKGNFFDIIEEEVVFEAYFSPDETLNETLKQLKQSVMSVYEEVSATSKGYLTKKIHVIRDANSQQAQTLKATKGITPLGKTDQSQGAFFHTFLTYQGKTVPVPIYSFNHASFKRSFEQTLQKFHPSFEKKVALLIPEQNKREKKFQMLDSSNPSFNLLEYFLDKEYDVIPSLIFGAGRLITSQNIDVVVVAAPKNLSKRDLYGIDQFLMRGGTVIALTSPFYKVTLNETSVVVTDYESGMEDWLLHHGVHIPKELVLDTEHRKIITGIVHKNNGQSFNKMESFPYPYFIDVAKERLNASHGIIQNLQQVTIPWASPLEIDPKRTAHLEVEPLLKTTPEAWLGDTNYVYPKANEKGLHKIEPQGAQQEFILSAALEGRFKSYFSAEDRPIHDEMKALQSFIPESIENSRLIVVGSNAALSDAVVKLLSESEQRSYLNTVQLVMNMVDYSLSDQALLGIRNRNYFDRTLEVIEPEQQKKYEYYSYAAVVMGLMFLSGCVFLYNRRKKRAYRAILS